MEGRLAAMFVDTDGRQGLEMAAEKGKSGMKKRKYQMLRVHMSWKFCLCVVGVVLLCSCSRFQGSFDKISLSAWLCDSREELLQMGESASAYSVMAGFQDMEWFAVLLPLLASFGSVTDFAGQWFSGYYYADISRKTYRRYAAGWLIRSALQGFASVALGILLYFLLVSCKFPHYGEFGLDAGNSMIAMAYGDTAGKRFWSLLLAVFHTGLLAAILAMLAVALTVFCKDAFFAVSSLALVGYFSIKLDSAFTGAISMQYFNLGQEIPMVYKIISFFFPSNHLYYTHNFSAQYGVGYWLYLVFLGLLAAGVWLWFYRMVKRRNG